MNMETREIEEGNKLIAEFMGWTISKSDNVVAWIPDKPGESIRIDSKSPYMSDWNELHRVVDKIYNVCESSSIVIDLDLMLYKLSIFADLLTVRSAVIDFIKWLTMYHNTTSEPQGAVAIYSKQCRTQEEYILNFLKDNEGKRFTPLQVWDQFPHYDKNSVRRSLTDLCSEGKIIHHDQDKVMERYGKPNTKYSYQSGQVKMFK